MAEDRKFRFENGRFVNRVSGEVIPDDEPVIIFRARDRKALSVLNFYLSICDDEHHKEAIRDRIAEFAYYQREHSERVKEPGITRHIELNSERAARHITVPEPGSKVHPRRGRQHDIDFYDEIVGRLASAIEAATAGETVKLG